MAPIDTCTAAEAICSPNGLAFLLGAFARHAGTPWHLLASFTAATIAQRFKDDPFAGRGELGPRLNDFGETLVTAEQHQAGRQAVFSDARKCLSPQYLEIWGSRFDSPGPAGLMGGKPPSEHQCHRYGSKVVVLPQNAPKRVEMRRFAKTADSAKLFPTTALSSSF